MGAVCDGRLKGTTSEIEGAAGGTRGGGQRREAEREERCKISAGQKLTKSESVEGGLEWGEANVGPGRQLAT